MMPQRLSLIGNPYQYLHLYVPALFLSQVPGSTFALGLFCYVSVFGSGALHTGHSVASMHASPGNLESCPETGYVKSRQRVDKESTKSRLGTLSIHLQASSPGDAGLREIAPAISSPFSSASPPDKPTVQNPCDTCEKVRVELER